MLEKPVLTSQQQRMEEKKKEIQDLMKHCQSRGESIKVLIDFPKPEDALILLERYTMDLLGLAGLIYDQKVPQTIEGTGSFVEKVPNEKLASLFLSICSSNDIVHGIKNVKSIQRKAYEREKAVNQIFVELQKAYKGMRRKQLHTAMDRYKSKVRCAMLLFFVVLIGAGAIIWSVSRSQERERVAQAYTDMKAFAELALAAKNTTNRSLVQITGSKCSLCKCKVATRLTGLTSEDPCVQGWNLALRKICEAAGTPAACTEKFKTDVWGSPYALDENEMEFGNADSRNDLILSAGPDRMFRTKDDLEVTIQNAFVK